jgi:hypothetical protein
MNPPAGQSDTRGTLLVGSIPAPGTHEAVTLALTELGPTLMCIPDGETGSRSQWVNSIIAELRNHPAVELVHDGRWSNYNDRPRYRVRRGATLDPDLLRLGYDAAFQQSRPVLDGLLAEHGLAGATYQVGLASGFDLALLAFGPVGALRYRKAFNRAASREIRSIQRILDDDVVFQIELPAEPSPFRARRGYCVRWSRGGWRASGLSPRRWHPMGPNSAFTCASAICTTRR